MDNIQLMYCSWCNGGGSNKVWGYFAVGNDLPVDKWGYPVFVFYGARGKALQLKEHAYTSKLLSLRDSKVNKGYKFVTVAEFLKVCPNFYSEVDNKLTFAILAGNKYRAVEN